MRHKNQFWNISFFSQKKVICERNFITPYEIFHMLAGVCYVCYYFVIFSDIITISNTSTKKKASAAAGSSFPVMGMSLPSPSAASV